MQIIPSEASTHWQYALICIGMLPELYLLLAPGQFRSLLKRVGVGILDPKAAEFFNSDRFLLLVRVVAATTLVLYGCALYLIHLRRPAFPKYGHH